MISKLRYDSALYVPYIGPYSGRGPRKTYGKKLKTQEVAHVVLFSSDLALSYIQLIDYYRLRFQIEFNFRDAKQYWGLEDFISVNERPVYNSANLSMFMVNVSHILRRLM